MVRHLIACVCLLLVPAVLVTAQPPPEGPASIVLVASPVHLGDTVTFTVTAPKGPQDKRVQVICIQPVPFTYLLPDGSSVMQTDPVVYGEAGPWDHGFLLGGAMSVWYLHDGPADCRADLYYWGKSHGLQTFVLLASTTFSALGR